MTRRRYVLLLCATLLVGCGTDPVAYESLAGTFTGSFTSTESGGAQFAGEVQIVFSQVDESLTGTWEISGTIMGVGTVTTSAGGGLSAALPLGADPSFQLGLAYSFCPQDIMTFATAYDSSSRTLTVVGELDIPSSQCNVLTAYPLSVSLSR